MGGKGEERSTSKNMLKSEGDDWQQEPQWCKHKYSENIKGAQGRKTPARVRIRQAASKLTVAYSNCSNVIPIVITLIKLL